MTSVIAITVYNGRTNKTERREVFTPTKISRASLLEARGSSSSKGAETEKIAFKLRIPLDAEVQDGRTYVNEAVYKTLSDEETAKHWTLRKGDYILAAQSEKAERPMTQPELDVLGRELCVDLIRVIEYADNTIRGSAVVKHWRIGGA
nr:MAG TPA: hypothetical protein [Caudoviricetes sp.]